MLEGLFRRGWIHDPKGKAKSVVLTEEGHARARELFERYCRDHPEYREQVLPSSVTARLSVEEGSTLGWARYVGGSGVALGMDTFGASAPLKALQKKFGFTPENIVAEARRLVNRRD